MRGESLFLFTINDSQVNHFKHVHALSSPIVSFTTVSKNLIHILAVKVFQLMLYRFFFETIK